MDTLINYFNTAPAQSGGKIIFLLALALIIGSSLLAFISELTHKTSAKAGYPVLSHNITRSSWLWVTFFALGGGLIIYLPKTAPMAKSSTSMIIGPGTAIALLFFLLYHFTGKTIKNKALHAPLALFAAVSALTAATFWYLPASYDSWLGLKGGIGNNFFSWFIAQKNIAGFIHFLLDAVAVSALLFMLANAREKEKKRKQPREYYFKASAFAGSWLITVVTLQIFVLGWIFYQSFPATSRFSPPTLYWFAGMLATTLLGWLLLFKINRDGLVNYRATLIISLFFIISLSLLHFSPLHDLSATTITQNHKTEKLQTQKMPPQTESQPQADTHKSVENQ